MGTEMTEPFPKAFEVAGLAATIETEQGQSCGK
jgi:hypothetical protein